MEELYADNEVKVPSLPNSPPKLGRQSVLIFGKYLWNLISTLLGLFLCRGHCQFLHNWWRSISRWLSSKLSNFKACIAYEPSLLDYVEFKRVTLSDPIWLLGIKYNVQSNGDFEKLNEHMQSLLWFTYRKHFLAIGESSLTSDSGWGCMHRCGQMIMAQAMIRRHLGKDWRWKPGCSKKIYHKIVQKFDDKIECPYSIHKIALKGRMIEKKVGEWFGPNTVVQVLKKLSEEDPENDISLHVAMDNMVVKSEIRKLFSTETKCSSDAVAASSSSQASEPSTSSQESNKDLCAALSGIHLTHSVLLTIPLRLGLCEITPVYFEKLKAVFTLKQTLGMIGGRTNHASYFIGYAGEELIYLDPHTTQVHKAADPLDDSTYHCNQPSRMSFTSLDPSIALCFYFENEEDFNHWCTDAQQVLLEPERDAIFEILENKPPMLACADVDSYDESCTSMEEKERIYTSDDEFELLL